MRDMSSSGAYFWTPNKPFVGDDIGFSIGLYTPEGRTVWKGQGRVLPTEPQDVSFGVAVKITSTARETERVRGPERSRRTVNLERSCRRYDPLPWSAAVSANALSDPAGRGGVARFVLVAT